MIFKLKLEILFINDYLFFSVLVDFNGDGLKDIVGFGADSLLLSIASDDGFSAPFTNVGGLAGAGSYNFFVI